MTVAVPAAGPDWASIMTAIGTVAVAMIAVGVALFAERRADKRVADERAHSAGQLREERERSAAQLEEERRLAREREQFAEAYAVQVVLMETDDPDSADDYGDPVGDLRKLAVVIVNRGSYTITRVEAQFSLDGGSLVSHDRSERVSGFPDLPERLRKGWSPPMREPAMHSVLTPWDTGLRFHTDSMHVKFLTSPVCGGVVDRPVGNTLGA